MNTAVNNKKLRHIIYFSLFLAILAFFLPIEIIYADQVAMEFTHFGLDFTLSPILKTISAPPDSLLFIFHHRIDYLLLYITIIFYLIILSKLYRQQFTHSLMWVSLAYISAIIGFLWHLFYEFAMTSKYSVSFGFATWVTAFIIATFSLLYVENVQYTPSKTLIILLSIFVYIAIYLIQWLLH